MTRDIVVKVRRFTLRPVGRRIDGPAESAALALPVADRFNVRLLAFVLTGATAEPARDASAELEAAQRCHAGFEAMATTGRVIGAVGPHWRMRGPTAAESRSIAARLEAVGGL